MIRDHDPIMIREEVKRSILVSTSASHTDHLARRAIFQYKYSCNHKFMGKMGHAVSNWGSSPDMQEATTKTCVGTQISTSLVLQELKFSIITVCGRNLPIQNNDSTCSNQILCQNVIGLLHNHTQVTIRLFRKRMHTSQ